jgi:hypothetical protein
MQEVRLDQIEFRADVPKLMKALGVREGGEEEAVVRRLARKAETIARPKALYRVAYIESKGDESVVIDGVTLKGRVLRVNLDPVERVFPFVATSGMEIEEWSETLDDVLEQFYADQIKLMALSAAIVHLEKHIDEHFAPGKMSQMNPGSLGEWPLSEQVPLFEILGDPKRSIGVQLSESLLMRPIKSVSGIRFPTEVKFESCQLCQRENCPNRRAKYDRTLHEGKFGAK